VHEFKRRTQTPILVRRRNPANLRKYFQFRMNFILPETTYSLLSIFCRW